jgi:hypothetical protein
MYAILLANKFVEPRKRRKKSLLKLSQLQALPLHRDEPVDCLSCLKNVFSAKCQSGEFAAHWKISMHLCTLYGNIKNKKKENTRKSAVYEYSL